MFSCFGNVKQLKGIMILYTMLVKPIMISIRLSKTHFIRKSYIHNSVKFENTEQ